MLQKGTSAKANLCLEITGNFPQSGSGSEGRGEEESSLLYDEIMTRNWMVRL